MVSLPRGLADIGERVEARIDALLARRARSLACADARSGRTTHCAARPGRRGREAAATGVLLLGVRRRRRRPRRSGGHRRRRGDRVAARVRPRARRRDGRLRAAARRTHGARSVRRDAPRRAAAAAKLDASARARRSSSATSPSCTPTSCSPAHPRTCAPCTTSCASSCASASSSISPARRAAGAIVRTPSCIERYKSGKYTVERPLHIGAALAGRLAELAGPLTAFGIPLGEAFQMRDDLLGVFGDPTVTGKPVGDDLREGKLTPLLAAAVAAADAIGRRYAALARVGRPRPRRRRDRRHPGCPGGHRRGRRGRTGHRRPGRRRRWPRWPTMPIDDRRTRRAHRARPVRRLARSVALGDSWRAGSDR